MEIPSERPLYDSGTESKMEEESISYEEKKQVHPGPRFLWQIMIYFQFLPKVGERHTSKKIVTFFVINIIILFPITLGMFGLVYRSFQDGFKLEMFECIDYMVNGAIYWMVLIVMLWRSDKYNTFYSENEIFRFGIPRIVAKRSELFRKFGKFSWLSINLVAISRVVATHIVNCPRENDEMNSVCVVGVPTWYPFKIQDIYLKTYIRISAGISVIYVANVFSSQSLVPQHIMYIFARIKHLERILWYTRFQKDMDADLKKLHFCIRYQTQIKRLVHQLNESIGYSLFPESTLVVLTLSLVEYRIVFEHDIMCLLLFAGWMSAIFVHCEMGHIINVQYDKLRWAVYGMNWYDMEPRLRKTYLILLGSVQQPITFFVPPMIHLNREFLLQVTKASYSFFMYLARVSDMK